MKKLLELERERGLSGLKGTSVGCRIPLTLNQLNNLFRDIVEKNENLRKKLLGIRITQINTGNVVSIELALNKPSVEEKPASTLLDRVKHVASRLASQAIPDCFNLKCMVEKHVGFPHSPKITIQLLDSSLQFILPLIIPVLRLFNIGESLVGNKVEVDLKEKLSDPKINMGDLGNYISSMEIDSREGVIFLNVELRV